MSCKPSGFILLRSICCEFRRFWEEFIQRFSVNGKFFGQVYVWDITGICPNISLQHLTLTSGTLVLLQTNYLKIEFFPRGVYKTKLVFTHNHNYTYTEIPATPREDKLEAPNRCGFIVYKQREPIIHQKIKPCPQLTNI